MDTNELSEDVYNLIWLAAEFDDNLKSILGSGCEECKDESEFLESISETLSDIRENIPEYLEDWGMEDEYSESEYKRKLADYEKKVKKVLESKSEEKKQNKKQGSST